MKFLKTDYKIGDTLYCDLPMSTTTPSGNPFVDCLLALEDVEFPGDQKPGGRELLQALLVSTKQKVKPDEIRTQPEIFADEVQKLVAQPQKLKAQDIVASTRSSIEELGQIDGENEAEAAKSMMLLTAALAMLKPLMNKEANNN